MTSEESRLASLVMSEPDPDKAADALGRLSKLSPEKASEIALQILNDLHRDRFFQAHAFHVLYAADFDKALRYIQDHGADVDSYVFVQMVESVTIDSVVMADNREENAEYFKTVSQIREYISLRKDDFTERTGSERDAYNYAVGWFTGSFSYL